MKRHVIVVAVFGVLLAGIGGIALFADSFAKDISDTKKNIDVIQDEYDKFKNLLQSFTGDREIIYSDVFNNLYLENIVCYFLYLSIVCCNNILYFFGLNILLNHSLVH